MTISESLPVDFSAAAHHYVGYAAGVAILNDPIRTQLIHNRSLSATESGRAAVDLLNHAEKLMYDGIRLVLYRVTPPGPLTEHEKRFDLVEPRLLVLRDYCYADSDLRLRLDNLNPFMATLRPMPVLEKSIYTAICHGRKQLVKTTRLMGGFTVADVFSGIVTDKRSIGSPTEGLAKAEL
jgi:hypothetical protein